MDLKPSIKVRTLDGSEYDLTQDALNNLKMRLKGSLFLPGDAGYVESSNIWNAMISRKPALVVRCLGVADVIACVKFSREHNLLLCIKGGGHNIAGLAIAEGALMLDMSLMRGVWVEPKARIAHAQAGCLLADVDRETQIHGLATVLGFVSQTGIAGLTLGGGFGYLTRRWGWTTDNVVGLDVVTADGRLVHASNDENADLFWGLRGGGGNFGVVTGIDYQLYSVGPEIVGGFVAWPASEALGVFNLFQSVAESAPDELTLVLIIRPAPPAPWIPKEYHGTPVAIIGACFSGEIEKGEKIVAPIKSYGTSVGDVLVRRPYTQLQTLLDAANPSGRRYYWKSEYLPGIGSDLGKKFIDSAGKIRSPYSAAILFQLGDALKKGNDINSATGNRDARYILNLASSWDNADADGENIEWARQAWSDLRQFSTGGTYINFLTEDDGPERTQAALGKELERLAEVKAKWDPENVFRINRNITPARY
ncbi:MAG: FAD-linked oxidase [Chloroflexi bacterium RBG_16_54_11]|nr:MAG: FAD-linked oxidase [Chloroflexi bacterium RBG_16_54_11]